MNATAPSALRYEANWAGDAVSESCEIPRPPTMSVRYAGGLGTRLKGAQMNGAQSATAMIGAVLCMTLVASGCSKSVEATAPPQATTDSPGMGSPGDHNGDLLPPGELATTSADDPKAQGEDSSIGSGALPAPRPGHEPRPAPESALHPAPPPAAAFPLPEPPSNTDPDPPPMGLHVVRNSYTGPCPPPAGEAPLFQAVISVDAVPTTVRYRWQDSNGGSPDTDWKEIEFLNEDNQYEIVDYTPTHDSFTLATHASVAIEVEFVWQSERVPYSITCVE